MNRSLYIDQWRGISVLMVIANHLVLFRFRDTFSIDKGVTFASKSWAKLVWFFDLWGINAGMVGVTIFFVISGFLITSLMLKEESRTGTVSLGAFYARRIFRIFPALLLYVGAIVALDAVGAIHTEPDEALSSSLFLCNTALVACGYHFSHLWSLGVEEQFYLFWPLLLLVSGRFRIPVVVVAFVVCSTLGVMPSMRIDGWINNGESFACICIGVLFALSARLRGLYALTARLPLLVWALLLVVVLPFARTRWAVADAMVMLALPHVIVAAVLVRSGRLRPSAPGKLLGQIGLISYSLYLWQAIATWDSGRYLAPWLAEWSFLAIGMAWLSYRYVEVPFVRLGKRFTSRPAREATQALAARDAGA